MAVTLAAMLPGIGHAQASQPPLGPVQLPTVTVTAQKEPADPQTLPLSITAITSDAIGLAGISWVSDAAIYAPNTYFSDFTARKLSNPRFRGLGSSPANPGVATYIDGVPQLNTNSSSVELYDVDQIEFVRGPQSALFGRNALGGLINITSTRPSLSRWTGTISAPFANRSERDVNGSVSGPLKDGKLGMSVSLGYARRDGFTTNDVTGHDLDSRSAFSGKGQLLWTPSRLWQARVIISGERARDGDYALNDLAAVRQNPFHVQRDFEGHTYRDIFSTTIEARRSGERVNLETVTGFVNWKTNDLTDLDYSPLPLVTRNNDEKDFQFTQEVRLASAGTPVKLSGRIPVRWQTGVFLFTQNYDQDAVNTIAPYLLSPALGFPIDQHSPQAALDDVGLGVYGQATTTFKERFDVSAGARLDYENKDATLDTFYSPPIAAPTTVIGDKSFTDVSPQFAFAARIQPGRMLYASAGEGFKAGGFNPASPPGSEAYGEEHAWHLEGGFNSSWASGRVSTHAAVFYIDWRDLQLNLPNREVPAQFYIANVGGATSTGVEVEVAARLQRGLDLFGGLGVEHGRFKTGSVSGGADVSGKKLPSTPDANGSVGLQITRDVRTGLSLYGRAELALYGSFQYDEANREGQDAYSLTNLRAGVRAGSVFVEFWMRNAFDTRYIPVAFAYETFAPSGFVGEPGKPRTFGVRAGVKF
jgi:iron complex outermembrane receptor protein